MNICQSFALTRYHQGRHELCHSKLQKVKLCSAPNLLMSICDQQKPVNKKDPQFFFQLFYCNQQSLHVGKNSKLLKKFEQTYGIQDK